MTIGVDWASIDKNSSPNFAAAKAAGIRSAIVRAVYGRGGPGGGAWLDPTWARDKDAILAAGLRRSAYLLLCYPQTTEATPSPEDQAQAFIDYVQLISHVDIVPCIDVEETSDVLSPTEMYAWTLRAAQKLQGHYNAWPMIYTSARVWADNLGGHSAGPLLACPLWIAKPWPWLEETPIHLDGAPNYSPTLIPEFGNNWACYQYQGDATQCPGFSSTVDASRWRVSKKGDTGAWVTWIQERVGVTADGIFGPATEATIKQVQAKYGLAVDGIVGLDTFTVIGWL